MTRTVSAPITIWDDVIDSRDIIARIEFLTGAQDEHFVDLDDSEEYELKMLQAFVEEHAADIEDWEYGATLIRNSYFVQYAQELADDIGAIDSDASWPLRHIDWDAAADELKHDYTLVDLDGQAYWVR